MMAIIGCEKAPTWRLDKAKKDLETASKAGALRYAEPKYREAEKIMKAGWMEMAHQNGQFAPFRRYHKADSLLTLASETALATATAADSIINNLDSLARSELTQLKRELIEYQNSLDGSLVIVQAIKYWTFAEQATQIGEQLTKKGEYEEARLQFSKARYHLGWLSSTVDEFVDDTASKIKVWRNWVQETIEETRSKNCHGLIVDKMAHKTYLIHAGSLIKTYNCELGYNSAQQKLFAGDGATPEGRYYITQVKLNGNSKYYKALLINYPNDTDRRRFSQNKAKGIISSRAGIGRLIEIHGQGGRNEDWTEGCVALTNHAMDEVVAKVGVGTPVTIVRRSDIWP
jgi:L,D-peptidoglycan transpeptidase YkuD (ErfK/YbiS/YcfS/YnhG family)